MLRQLLSRSKAAIVHSGCVESELRGAGFSGAVARIPHGAWIPDANRSDFRERLGLDETTPLIGIFGFLKPYKRIAESLRAFRRLVRVQPSAKMILVGEPHPELQLESLIRSLDLGLHVRVLGFRPIEEFVGYLAACDIVLNLRYPTVGENSGTLMRALGLGKAVVVSDVGSFSELPETICLKAPVDATEEDHLFEYLNLLVSRPEDAQGAGRAGARMGGDRVHLAQGGPALCGVSGTNRWQRCGRRSAAAIKLGACQHRGADVHVEPEYILSWAPDEAAKGYIETHLTRFEKTLAITPPGGPGRPHSRNGLVSANHARARNSSRLW